MPRDCVLNADHTDTIAKGLSDQIVPRGAAGSEAPEISRTFPTTPFSPGLRSLFELALQEDRAPA